ncbi:MAG: rhodanese-like domain-containing protein [Eggerthellaceae bacterium]|nr:rhodanese-like domain-containing protein [Eggerthellaceae bacterium]
MVHQKKTVYEIFAIMAALSLVSVLALGCSAPTTEDGAASASNAESSASDASTTPSEASSEANKDVPFSQIPEGSLITAQELHEMLDAQDAPFVLDIRSAGKFTNGFIPGSKNIPAGRQIDLRLDEIPKGQTIVLVSSGESRLGEAWQTLVDAGFAKEDILVVSDGIEAWSASGYPLDSRESLGC